MIDQAYKAQQLSATFLVWGAVLLCIRLFISLFLTEIICVLRYVYPAVAVGMGGLFYVHNPPLYISFAWFIWFFTPAVRRMVDVQVGFSDMNPIMLTPFLVAAFTLFTLLRYRSKLLERTYFPFLLVLLGIGYAYMIGLVKAGLTSATYDLLNWMVPVLFGLHFCILWQHYPVFRSTIQRTFTWGVLIMGVYGVMQFMAPAAWASISGTYMESRTCQVYTGPCFANAESGLAGRNAIMAWQINQGQHEGIDLAGLSVVVVVDASDTLGFQGINDPQHVSSVILLDEKASEAQREALVDFAKIHAGRAGESVMRISAVPIDMSLDVSQLQGQLTAGTDVKLVTRKARPDDCICSNESAYYPPLAKVDHFVPGVTVEGEFNGRGLGTRWSTPGDRSAYMGMFTY
jgi:hypothetical protein